MGGGDTMRDLPSSVDFGAVIEENLRRLDSPVALSTSSSHDVDPYPKPTPSLSVNSTSTQSLSHSYVQRGEPNDDPATEATSQVNVNSSLPVETTEDSQTSVQPASDPKTLAPVSNKHEVLKALCALDLNDQVVVLIQLTEKISKSTETETKALRQYTSEQQREIDRVLKLLADLQEKKRIRQSRVVGVKNAPKDEASLVQHSEPGAFSSSTLSLGRSARETYNSEAVEYESRSEVWPLPTASTNSRRGETTTEEKKRLVAILKRQKELTQEELKKEEATAAHQFAKAECSKLEDLRLRDRNPAESSQKMQDPKTQPPKTDAELMEWFNEIARARVERKQARQNSGSRLTKTDPVLMDAFKDSAQRAKEVGEQNREQEQPEQAITPECHRGLGVKSTLKGDASKGLTAAEVLRELGMGRFTAKKEFSANGVDDGNLDQASSYQQSFCETKVPPTHSYEDGLPWVQEDQMPVEGTHVGLLCTDESIKASRESQEAAEKFKQGVESFVPAVRDFKQSMEDFKEIIKVLQPAVKNPEVDCRENAKLSSKGVSEEPRHEPSSFHEDLEDLMKTPKDFATPFSRKDEPERIVSFRSGPLGEVLSEADLHDSADSESRFDDSVEKTNLLRGRLQKSGQTSSHQFGSGDIVSDEANHHKAILEKLKQGSQRPPIPKDTSSNISIDSFVAMMGLHRQPRKPEREFSFPEGT